MRDAVQAALAQREQEIGTSLHNAEAVLQSETAKQGQATAQMRDAPRGVIRSRAATLTLLQALATARPRAPAPAGDGDGAAAAAAPPPPPAPARSDPAPPAPAAAPPPPPRPPAAPSASPRPATAAPPRAAPARRRAAGQAPRPPAPVSPWSLGIDFGTSSRSPPSPRRAEAETIDFEANGRGRMPSATFVDVDGDHPRRHRRTAAGDRGAGALRADAQARPRRPPGVPRRPASSTSPALAGALLRRVYAEACRQQGDEHPPRSGSPTRPNGPSPAGRRWWTPARAPACRRPS